MARAHARRRGLGIATAGIVMLALAVAAAHSAPKARGARSTRSAGGAQATSDGGGRYKAASPGGRVLFEESFDAAGASSRPRSPGWSMDHPEWWSVADGRLRARLPNVKQQRSLATFGSAQWHDVALDVDLCGVRGVDKGVVLEKSGDDGLGVDLRGDRYGDLLVYRGARKLARTKFPNRNGRWYHLRVELAGDRVRVLVDGRQIADARDEKPTHGPMALAAYTGGAGACELQFDNVRVTSLR